MVAANGCICTDDASDDCNILLFPEVLYTGIYDERIKGLIDDKNNFTKLNLSWVMMRLNKYFLLVLFLFISHTVYGSVTGKIQGKVTDKKTGEALPGVNVMVVGTTLGAATDINGEYFILQVTPGEYSVKASMIGYREVIVQNTRVRADLTTNLNFEIEETTVQLDGEVVVTAERPIIQKDVTS
jgi:hypothetical protein